MARRLAIIVVNYGSAHLLAKNLARTTEECTPGIVVVVDNYSTDEERAAVSALCEQRGWALVAPKTNLGFGGGMNLGAATALALGATELLLLNPDAYIGARSLSLLQSAIGTSCTTVAAPRIVDSHGRVFFAGADVYLRDGATRGFVHRGDYPGYERWEWLSGACVLIPRTIWLTTNGIDEDYFLYWEDVDFSRRVTKAGGKLIVVNEATAVHDEGGTQVRAKRHSRAKSGVYYYYNIRNRMLFATKHLDADGMKRWRRGAWRSAREVVLRGGRRQLLRPLGAAAAAFRGVRDGRRDIAQALSVRTRENHDDSSGDERST